MKLVYAFCGSFCTHARSLEALKVLAASHEITPAFSEIVRSTDTRFGRADALLGTVSGITGREPIFSVKEAEEVVTNGKFDAVVVAPCTGNTLAKLANGITDGAVTMCVKAQLRSRGKVIIALATNDGLSANLFNIALMLEKKNVFFVPFGQDSPKGKPSSLVCDFNKIGETIEEAMAGRQIQPILVE